MRTNRFLKAGALSLSFAVAMLAPGCGGSGESKPPAEGGGRAKVEDVPKGKVYRVAMVLPGNITDKSWNQSGYEGLQLVKEKLDAEVAFTERVAQPDQKEAMSDFARRGYDVVIGHGGEFQGAASQVASEYPKATAIVTNGTTAGANLATISFENQQFGYLLGYLGGKMSKSGKGGFLGAQKIKASLDLAAGFEKGFKAARPDGQVLVGWTNDWDDVAKGKEAALSQISQGVDVIFPTMDNAVVGSLQAAKEKKIWAMGLYYDAIKNWPDIMLQSAILDIRLALVEVIGEFKAGKGKGKPYVFGVGSSEAARLGTFHSSVPADVRAEVEKIAADLASGKLKP